MDWNWFFAAFAQCAAALVAIIGAFVISKLLGEGEKQEQAEEKFDSLLMRYKDLRRKLSYRPFKWLDKRRIEDSDTLGEQIQSGSYEGLSEDDRLTKLLNTHPQLWGTENCLQYLDERIKKESKKPVNKFARLVTSNTTSLALIQKIEKEEDVIFGLRVESEKLIVEFTDFSKMVKIRRHNLIPIGRTIWFLIIGLILTVIYPLHFLPIEMDSDVILTYSVSHFFSLLFSLKGFLMLSLAIVFIGIFLYFLLLLKKILRGYIILGDNLKPKFYKISSYCKYFKEE